MTPPYRTPNGNWYTVALFYEPSETFSARSRDDIEPIWCLYESKKGLPSAQRQFVELEDPTGYKWAMQYLGSWAHWQRLLKASWFREALEVWNQELSAKLKSKAIEQIQEIASTGAPAQALAAAKYLATEDYNSTSGRGRPSKEEVKGNLKKAVELLDEEKDDIARIGLKLVHGGA